METHANMSSIELFQSYMQPMVDGREHAVLLEDFLQKAMQYVVSEFDGYTSILTLLIITGRNIGTEQCTF